MPLTFEVIPGYEFGPSEKVDNAKLNQLGRPVGVVLGDVEESNMAAGAVGAANLKLGAFSYGVSAGTASAYTLDFPTEQESALVDGLEVVFKAHITCAGNASMTLDGTATKLIQKFVGVNVEPGDIRENQIVALRYSDSAGGAWLMVSPRGQLDLYFVPDTGVGGTGNAITLALAPALTTASDIIGKPIRFVVKAVNTGAVVANIDGIGNRSVFKHGVVQLDAGDLPVGAIVCLVYDGANLHLQSPIAATGDTVGWGGNADRIAIHRSLGSPNSQIICSHSGIVLRHRTSKRVAYISSANGLTTDITVTGLGGLDVGVEANSTYYYLWIMSDGTNQSLVLSLSNTAPAALGAYDYIGMVGIAFNNSAGNFLPFYIKGRRCWHEGRVAGTGLTGPGTGGASLSIAGFLPVGASTARLRVGRTDNTIFNAIFAPDSAGVEVQAGMAAMATALDTFMACATLEIPLTQVSTIFWRTADTGNTYRVVVCGFEF